MEKRREIPGAKKPNAAPKVDVDRVLSRFEQLGLDGEDAVAAAGLGRATYYRLKKYEASVATVRKLDEWLLQHAKGPSTPSSDEQQQLLAEWQRLGERLMKADSRRFASALEGLRDMTDALEMEQRAIRKMFRANSGSDD